MKKYFAQDMLIRYVTLNLSDVDVLNPRQDLRSHTSVVHNVLNPLKAYIKHTFFVTLGEEVELMFHQSPNINIIY